MQPNIQPFTCSRLFNRFDSRLYRVNRVLDDLGTLCSFNLKEIIHVLIGIVYLTLNAYVRYVGG